MAVIKSISLKENGEIKKYDIGVDAANVDNLPQPTNVYDAEGTDAVTGQAVAQAVEGLQDAATAITTSNIASQSVNNATKWANYTIRVGNYSSGAAGYITFSTN